ncbi:calcium-activated chloride channel regulator 1-like [Amblyomma americanum]
MGGQLYGATALLCLMIKVSSLEIDTTDGGYKDLLISIHKDVPYNESIVKNIKALLQASSEFLHSATNGRVYFKHVIIDFPNTWPERSSARRVSWSAFDKSDVRVQQPGSAHEMWPFTRQSRPCGQPGDYIKIQPQFLSELNGSTTTHCVNPAYVFVHEWAHYRYGVFDEYGSQDDDKYPLTYCHDGKVKLNSCSGRIRYRATAANGEKCMITQKCQFLKNCMVQIYQPDVDPAEASIMFMPYQSNVSQFCDSSKGPRQHNAFAPNKQNKICNGRPTWEVISENEDFKKAPRSDMSKRIQVSFEETQQKEILPQRVVLVLDLSESMANNSRLEFLKEAARRYISDIPDGSKRLAIVVFSRIALVYHTLMPVNVNTRQGFLDTVDRLQEYTSTCIGCGLEMALEVLNTTDETPEGAILVLMSDGEENEAPLLDDVMPKVVAAKVEVSTLALGAAADNKLEKLATATKGRAFFFEDLQGNTALQMESAFVAATTSQADESSQRYTHIMDSPTLFTRKLVQKFILERSLGNNTIVVIQRVPQSSGHITAWLVDPSGQRCQACQETGSDDMKTIFIPSPAKAGTWTLHLESSSPYEVEVNIQIKSQAKEQSDEPIRASCRMASLEVNKPMEAIILATVTKGSMIILNAEVTAEVTRPKPPHKVQVRLNDDGQDPDVQADDGTYSGYFTQFAGRGRYAVTAHVSGHQRTRLVEPRPGSGSFCSRAHMLNSSTVPILDAEYEYTMNDFIVANATAEDSNATSAGGKVVDPFQRIVHGGSFQVTGEITEEQVPPGDVRDLAVREIRPGENASLSVRITWTWPGARLMSGNASSIEIRASKNHAKLNSDFDKQAEITKANVIEGNLDPLPPGVRHEVTVSLPRTVSSPRDDGASDWNFYLAARAVNSDGVKSKSSNIVPVSYKAPPVTTTIGTTTIPTTTQATTTVATTTIRTKPPVTTTTATTAVAKTTQSTTTTSVPATIPASTPAGSEQDQESKTTLLPLWVWIQIGAFAVVIFIAIFVGVLMKMSTRNRRIHDLLVCGLHRRQQVAA